MPLQITNVSINFDNGQMGNVQVYFNSRYTNFEEERQLNLNGNVAISSQEYLNNPSTDALLNIVEQRVVEFVNQETGGTVGTSDYEEEQQNQTLQANNQTTTNNNTTDNNEQPRQARTRTNKQ